jgi:hypothetical protein
MNALHEGINNLLITGITILYMEIILRVHSLQLGSMDGNLTNPIFIPSNVLPSNVQSSYPNIALLGDLWACKTKFQFQNQCGRRGIVKSTLYLL